MGAFGFFWLAFAGDVLDAGDNEDDDGNEADDDVCPDDDGGCNIGVGATAVSAGNIRDFDVGAKKFGEEVFHVVVAPVIILTIRALISEAKIQIMRPMMARMTVFLPLAMRPGSPRARTYMKPP